MSAEFDGSAASTVTQETPRPPLPTTPQEPGPSLFQIPPRMAQDDISKTPAPVWPPALPTSVGASRNIPDVNEYCLPSVLANPVVNPPTRSEALMKMSEDAESVTIPVVVNPLYVHISSACKHCTNTRQLEPHEEVCDAQAFPTPPYAQVYRERQQGQ